MAVMGSYRGEKWDVSIDPTTCNRYNNADLTLGIRVHLDQVNPAGGAATGTMVDAGGTSRGIVQWTPSQWTHWTQRYQRECQRFWDGKFWLMTPRTFDE